MQESIRALLTAANSVPGPHTITFDNTGHFSGGGTITLASPLPAISNSISVLGWLTAASNNAVTVNGSALVFHPGTTNTIQNLNIGNSVTNGQSLAMSGCSITSGGIYSTGSLQLVSTTVIGSPGAGIWSSGNATLNEVTVALSQNGGIYNAGNLVISNSVIVSNSCPSVGGGIYSLTPLQVWRCNIGYNTALSGRGGGIFTAAESSIYETTLNYNVARQDAGGGIYSSSNLTMNGCLLSSNAAHGRPGTAGGGAGAATGGGLYQESGRLFATNCTFSANQVIGGPGIIANAAGSGGGPFPGSGGVTGSSAACGIAGGSGGTGSEGGILSGGGGGGQGGASYSGGIVSGCYKYGSAKLVAFNYYDIRVICSKHNTQLNYQYNVASSSYPNASVQRCP